MQVRKTKTNRLSLLLSITLVSALLDASVCFAQKEDNVDIKVDESYASAARFLLTTKKLSEGTVSLKCERCENVSSSQKLPVVFLILKPYTDFEFLRFSPKATGAWHYNWSFHYKIGIPSSSRTIDYTYSLPYASSNHFKVTQSYLGAHSHFQGSGTEYAVDFAMPEGTTILAAREGLVVAFLDESDRGGDIKSFANDANQIVVKHDDGTYASYMHLKQHGVLVKLGQKVSAGSAIGLSGNTGWSTQPHLHFGIYRVLNGDESTSLPFKMQTSTGVFDRLMAGEFY